MITHKRASYSMCYGLAFVESITGDEKKEEKLEEKPMLDINATQVFGKIFIFVRNC